MPKKKLKWCKRKYRNFKAIFAGFEEEYENIIIKQAHFFPQRMTTGAMMALVVVGFICFAVIIGSVSLLAFLSSYIQVIKDAYMN